MDKELYKRMEAILYNYNQNKLKIKTIELDLHVMKGDYDGTCPVSYERSSSKTNRFNSTVENEIINKEERLQTLIQLKGAIEVEVQKVSLYMDILNERDREIIEMRYFKKKSNKYIAAELYLSEEYVCRLRKKIITKMIEFMF